MLRRAGMRAVQGTAAGRVVQPVRPNAAASRRVAVQAASTEPALAEESIATAQAPQTSALASFSSDPEVAEMELAELDAAQEQVLTWMLNHTEQQHEEDLDEMVDYDEFGDEEYAEIQDQVEQMIDASYSTLTMGDQVKGTVYEVDDDGAYIEIGEKASGFVPLSECSFAKLKSVSACPGCMQQGFRPLAAGHGPLHSMQQPGPHPLPPCRLTAGSRGPACWHDPRLRRCGPR